jgi:hypothetical protein
LTPGADASLEQKIEHLLDRSVETQNRLGALEAAVGDQRRDVEKQLEDSTSKLTGYVDSTIELALSEYVWSRRFGLVCLGIALVLWTVSSFV